MTSESPDHYPSTGTLTGKESSSRNALKHGCCSTATLILPGESREDFLALENRWFQAYAIDPGTPAADYQAELIRTAARAEWFFLRAERNLAEVEAQIMTTVPDLLEWNDSHHAALARFLRYRTTHANNVVKHRKALEDYRRNRAVEAGNVQKTQRHTQQLAIASEKHGIYKEKNPPPLTWEEEKTVINQRATDYAALTASRQPISQPPPDLGY